MATSRSDPFTLPDIATLPGNYNVVSKSIVNPRLIASENTAVFVVAGQSNAANSGDTPYTPTNAKVHNLNVSNGALYAAADPLVGCSNAVSGVYGNMFTRMADKLVTAGKYQRVILIPIALGGTSIDTWKTILFGRINVAFRRAAAQGYTVTALLWQQGEADTDLATTQAAYTASFNAMRSKLDDVALTTPWLLAKSTYSNGATSTPIRSAVSGLINGTTLLTGPDTDTLTGTTINRRDADNTHFKAAGAEAAAVLWRDVIMAELP